MKTNTVMLYSGGLDSLCAAQLCKPDVKLYIACGSKYEEQEIARLPKDVTVLTGVLNLARWEREDFIIPNRNTLLVTLATMYGDEILLCAVDGDRSCDKDSVFSALAGSLLRHTWQAQHWTPMRTIHVSLPVALYTKTALLRRAIAAGLSHKDVLHSWSCYEHGAEPCGTCKPCVRKYIALVANHVQVPKTYYKRSPYEAEWLPQVLADIDSGKRWRCPAEDSEFAMVFGASVRGAMR